jgi:protein SCO1/2
MLRRLPLPLAGALVLAAALAACSRQPPPREYTLTGQVLAVLPDQRLTVKHDDIAGFMPAMTMNYPVAAPALMQGRTPGELITATLQVTDAGATLTAITHTGSAPLPTGTNAAALAEGILGVGDQVPDAAFIDQANVRRSISEWKGSLTLVTFIYTSCPLPTFCPLMDQNFATIQRAVADDTPLRGHVKLISISIDPAHDTPAVLADHARKLQADPAVWTFLTGDQATTDRFAGRFGVSIVRADGPEGITHQLRTALVDRDGKIRKIYSGNDWTPGAVLADLRAALAGA